MSKSIKRTRPLGLTDWEWEQQRKAAKKQVVERVAANRQRRATKQAGNADWELVALFAFIFLVIFGLSMCF